MNLTIWKKILRPQAVQEIDVPVGSELLCAREQFGEICVWFCCNPTAKKEVRGIAIVGTGHSVPPDGRYIGTAFLLEGQMVWHVFEYARIAKRKDS